MNAYTSNAVGVDEAMYERDDFVVLFAAGNDGQDNGAQVTQGTVGAPGTAKNGSWWKAASTLFDHSAPLAPLGGLKARAAPTHPRAQPRPLGSSSWPQPPA